MEQCSERENNEAKEKQSVKRERRADCGFKKKKKSPSFICSRKSADTGIEFFFW